jgi:membrane associated rhomboid family serine protease
MTPWVTRLIIANVAVFFLTLAVPGLASALVLVPAFMVSRPWTLVTYMFLHSGVGHIFWNMLFLYFFGPRVEDRLGGSHFAWLYFVSGICGGLLSYPFTPYAPIMGASGAVYGVALGFAYYWPRETIYVWGVLPVQAWIMVAVMTGIDLVSGITGGGGAVAHFAHLGGFAGGFVMLKYFELTSRTRRFKAKMQAPRSRGDVERWSKVRREALHEVNRAEYDRIMAKLKERGLASLTSDERTTLDNFSNRAL